MLLLGGIVLIGGEIVARAILGWRGDLGAGADAPHSRVQAADPGPILLIDDDDDHYAHPRRFADEDDADADVAPRGRVGPRRGARRLPHLRHHRRRSSRPLPQSRHRGPLGHLHAVLRWTNSAGN